MKISLDWLNSYLDRPVDSPEAQRLLTDVGYPIESAERVGEDDVLLDVEVTNNRSDLHCHLNLAREVAAASQRVATPPVVALIENADERAEQTARVEVTEPGLCPVYTARVIRGVRIGPSPAWLVARLEAVGLRSVNNVVDVTNFVLQESGQPLHAFDLSRLDGAGRLIVRLARPGEPFAAIDGSEHTLSERVLVIADASRPVAVAGVMGGAESEVTDQTTDILLESAQFDPVAVRRASRDLKLQSDSSFRFERGIDPAGVEVASQRAAALICELAGGKLASGVIRVGADEPDPIRVSMRPERCNRVLGVELGVNEAAAALRRLDLAPTPDAQGTTLTCTIPTRRLDLTREIDLIEEVARLVGYDRISVTEKIHIVARPVDPPVAARQTLARVLVAHGYHEAITFSFIRTDHGGPFIPTGEQAVTVDDDRRKAESMLRPSLLPSLLACRKSNQDVGNSGVRLFETAAAWAAGGGEIVERQQLALLCDAVDASETLRGLSGLVQEIAECVGAGPLRLEAAAPDRCFQVRALVQRGDDTLGRLGLISPSMQKLFGLQTQVVAAEFELAPLLEGYPPQHEVSELPRFPTIERDLSIVVPESCAWAQVREVLPRVGEANLEGVEFLGVYRGKPLAKGVKSVSFRLVYRDPEGTLRREQVEPGVSELIELLKERLGAELRV